MLAGVAFFCSLEDILHPWHGVYSQVPQATPDLAISHRSEVRFNRAVRQVTYGGVQRRVAVYLQ